MGGLHASLVRALGLGADAASLQRALPRPACSRARGRAARSWRAWPCSPTTTRPPPTRSSASRVAGDAGRGRLQRRPRAGRRVLAAAAARAAGRARRLPRGRAAPLAGRRAARRGADRRALRLGRRVRVAAEPVRAAGARRLRLLGARLARLRAAAAADARAGGRSRTTYQMAAATPPAKRLALRTAACRRPDPFFGDGRGPATPNGAGNDHTAISLGGGGSCMPRARASRSSSSPAGTAARLRLRQAARAAHRSTPAGAAGAAAQPPTPPAASGSAAQFVSATLTAGVAGDQELTVAWSGPADVALGVALTATVAGPADGEPRAARGRPRRRPRDDDADAAAVAARPRRPPRAGDAARRDAGRQRQHAAGRRPRLTRPGLSRRSRRAGPCRPCAGCAPGPR